MARKVLGQLRKQLASVETEVENLLCAPGARGNPRYLRRMLSSLRASVDEVEALFPVSAAQADNDPRNRSELDAAADEFDADLDGLDASCSESSASSDSSQSDVSSSSSSAP